MDVQEIQQNLSRYNIRKTLYIACDYAMELEIGRHLTMMSDAFFKCKEMKIVTINVIKGK